MTDQDIQDYLALDPRYVSITALNPFMNHNSASRGLMLSSHLSQAVTLLKGDEQIIQGGMDRELGKTSMMYKFDCDARVISIIPRYHQGYTSSDVGFVSEVTIIYEDLDNKTIRNMTIPYASNYHNYFGFQYVWDRDTLASLEEGSFIANGTILAKSPALGENYSYRFGVNANVAMLTFNETTEDAVQISESFAKRISFDIFEKRSFDIDPDDVLINLYGTVDNYKPLPDYGDTIDPSGVLVVKRKYDEYNAISLLSATDLMDFDPNMDEAIYVREGKGVIVDIKIIHTPKTKKDIFHGMGEFLQKYSDAYMRWRRDIISSYDTIKKTAHLKDMDIDPDTTRIIVESMAETNHQIFSKQPQFKRKMRNEDPGIYRVEYTIKYTITPGIGYKLTDLSGGKSVICSVLPDDKMPIDKNGVRADIVLDPATTPRRMNLARLFYGHISKASRNLKHIIIDELNALSDKTNPLDTVDKLDSNTIHRLFSIVTEFTSYIGNKQHEVYSAIKDHKQKRTILKEIVEHEFYIYYKLGDNNSAIMANNFLGSRFLSEDDKVTVKTSNGYKESAEDVMIAPLYIMMLSKIADTWLATSSAKTNHFGLPVSVNKADKYRLPWRNSPTRTLGETEYRIIAGYGGEEFAGELKDMGSSIESHKEMYSAILRADKPGNIDRILDRDKSPYGRDKALEILESILAPAGMELVYIADDEEYVDMLSVVENVMENVEDNNNAS